MTSASEHLSFDMLRRYCEGELADFEELAVEDHFAVCDECVETAQRIDALLVSGFTAEAHAAAIAAETLEANPLAAALRRAAAVYGDCAATLCQWLDQLRVLPELAALPLLGEPVLIQASGGAELPVRRISFPAGQYDAECELWESEPVLEIETANQHVELALLFDTLNPEVVRVSRLEAAGPVRRAHFSDVAAGRYQVSLGPRY